jgi:hypothetical protein
LGLSLAKLSVMSEYQKLQAPDTCAICERALSNKAVVYFDPFLDEEDGLCCLPCLAGILSKPLPSIVDEAMLALGLTRRPRNEHKFL